jgi:hypothetical protein
VIQILFVCAESIKINAFSSFTGRKKQIYPILQYVPNLNVKEDCFYPVLG